MSTTNEVGTNWRGEKVSVQSSRGRSKYALNLNYDKVQRQHHDSQFMMAEIISRKNKHGFDIMNI